MKLIFMRTVVFLSTFANSNLNEKINKNRTFILKEKNKKDFIENSFTL